MTDDRLAVARQSYAFWRPLVRLPLHWQALLGNEDGETSFRPHVVGDRGEAFGPFQWHAPRADAMLAKIGIDVRTAPHLDQLKAAHWEMTAGGYQRVWPMLMATDTLWSAVTCSFIPMKGRRSRGGTCAAAWRSPRSGPRPSRPELAGFSRCGRPRGGLFHGATP